MVSTKIKINYGVLILLLLMNSFFGILFLKGVGSKLVYVFIPMFWIFMIKYRNIRSYYSIPLILYSIFVLISCFYSYLWNYQDFIKCARSTYPAWGLMTFFTFFAFKTSSAETWKVLKIFCIFFCLAYLLQWVLYPTILFGAGDSDLVSDEEYRARMPSSICSYILYFYGVKNIFIKRKPIYALYAILGFVPMLIMGFRSLMASSMIMTVVMVILIYIKSVWKTVIAVAALTAFTWGALHIPLVQYKIDEMMERQEDEQTFDNSDYVRYIEYDFFTKTVFVKPGEKIFGGGYPDGASNYSKYLSRNQMFGGMYWVDLGIVGLSWIIGIPAVILLVYLVLLCVWRSKERDLIFIRYALLSVLLGSLFTSMELFRECNMIIIGMLFYIEYTYHEEKTAWT